LLGRKWKRSVMLNEAKISRPTPRPRPGPLGRGRDQGQSFEVKAEDEANFLTSRPRPRPKLRIKSIKWCWHHAGEFTSFWSKRHSYFLTLSRTVTIFCHSVMSCSQQSKMQTDWSVDLFLAAGLLVLLLQTEARPRPNVWGQGRGRGQSFEAETEVEAKILAWRPLWPRGLNIFGAWALQPPPQSRENRLFLVQKLNFSGKSQQPTAKNEILFVFIKRKTEFILSSEMKCPKSGIFTNKHWVGWVERSNFAGYHGTFSGRCRNIFRAKMAQPPKKFARMPMPWVTLRGHSRSYSLIPTDRSCASVILLYFAAESHFPCPTPISAKISWCSLDVGIQRQWRP